MVGVFLWSEVMQQRPNISREKIEKILKIHDEIRGYVGNIAKLAGSSTDTVKNVLIDRGESYLSKIEEFEEDVRRMREMFLSGMSTTEIGKKFGVKNGAVRHRCRDLLDKIKEEKQKLQDAGLRKCGVCGEIKSLEVFGSNKESSVGKGSYCLVCLATIQRNRKHDLVCQHLGCGVAFKGCCANRKYCDEHTINRWTYEECHAEAQKYLSRSAFACGSPTHYEKSTRAGWDKMFFQEVFGDRLAFGFRKIDFIEACNRKNGGKGKLYLIKCWGNGEMFYKVGITSGTVKGRHKSKRDMPYEYEILWTVEGDAEEIWNMELARKRETKNIRYQPELWPNNNAQETFKCHGNCKILRNPDVT